MSDDEAPFLTAREVAARLRVNVATVRNWTRRRQIPCVRVGGRVIFSSAALDEWLRRRTRPVLEESDW